MARRKPQTKKPNRNTRGSRSKDFEDSNKQDREYDRSKPDNDFEWYNRVPAITGDAANILFSWPTGKPLSLKADGTYKWVAPGIQTLYLAPNYGLTSDVTSPLNIAAQQLFSYMRKDQTSTSVFDRPDVMLYNLAIADVFSYLEFLRRTYGIARDLYSDINLYAPRHLLYAANIDADDVLNNLADFRYGINVLIRQIATLAVPAVMTIFPRKAFLYSSLYTEGSSAKDQLYQYAPAGFYKFSLNTDTKAGQLDYVQFLDPTKIGSTTPTGMMKVKDLLIFGRQLINALLDSGDAGIISGATLRTFGEATIKMNYLPEDYTVVPTFDIVVLEQMKNATVLQYNWYNKPSLTQEPATNNLQFIPELDVSPTGQTAAYSRYLTAALDIMQFKKFLQTTTSELNSALILENSRLIAGLVQEDAEQPTVLQIYAGSEICVGCSFWKADTDIGGLSSYAIPKRLEHITLLFLISNDASELASGYGGGPYRTLELLQSLSAFDFAPPTYLAQLVSSKDQATFIDSIPSVYLHDVDNFTILDSPDIIRLHEAAWISMLDAQLYNKMN